MPTGLHRPATSEQTLRGNSNSPALTALRPRRAVIYEPTSKDDALAAALATSGAEVLVVRSTQVTEPMLDAGQLSLIVRAGAGVNTIDVAAASRRGIYVSNCPGQERRRGRRADVCADAGAGSARSRQRRRTSRAAAGTRRSFPRRRACSAGRWGSSASATSVRKWRGAPARSGCRSWCGAGDLRPMRDARGTPSSDLGIEVVGERRRK